MSVAIAVAVMALVIALRVALVQALASSVLALTRSRSLRSDHGDRHAAIDGDG